MAHNDDEEQSRAFQWWRNDQDHIKEHKDGLNIDGVGLPQVVRTLARILPGTSREAADKTFLEVTQKQAESAAAFGIVTVDDPYLLEQQLAGVRLLQRLHLLAAAHDLGFQHMNQITERIDRDRQLGTPPIFDQPLADLVDEEPWLHFGSGPQPSIPWPAPAGPTPKYSDDNHHQPSL